MYLVASATVHFQLIEPLGTVPAFSAPLPSLGDRTRVTPPAAVLVIIVIAPVVPLIVIESTFLVLPLPTEIGSTPRLRLDAVFAAFSEMVAFAPEARTRA